MQIHMIAERQHIKTVRHIPTPLQVAGWEARRYWANSASKRLTIIAFGLFALLSWPLHHPGEVGFSSGAVQINYLFSGTSAYGMVYLIFSYSFLLALLLPLVSSSGVAHDVKDRTHELLMTTTVPSWAYIIGRYLFYLFASMCLSLILLVTVLLMGLIYHLAEHNYLAPQVDVVLGIWAIGILPMTIVISSLSFVLGTLFPRRPNVAALGVIVAWYLPVFLLLLVPVSGIQLPLWTKTWDPTNIGMGSALQAPYQRGLDTIMQSPLSNRGIVTMSDGQHLVAQLQALEQKMPDLLPWLVPHLVWAGVGLTLVLVVAVTFKRFRSVLNG